MADIFAYENGSNTLAFVLMTLTVGIVAACAVMLWQIKVPGAMVRVLSKRGAVGRDKAVPAAELGYKNELFLRFLLSENSALSKYVDVILRDRDRKGRGIYTTASICLREETKDRAELRYNRKNATVGALIAAMIVFSILAVILNFIIPDLIQMLENFINSLKESS